MKFILILILLISACSDFKIEDKRNNQMSGSQMIEEINQRSGLNLEITCEILLQEDNLTGHQQSQGWLIKSEKPIKLPKGKNDYQEDNDAINYLTRFESNVPRHSFGKLKSESSSTSLWGKDEAERGWQGTTISTDNGYYLDLEWVKQSD